MTAPLEERALRTLRTRLHAPALDRVAVRFSALGEHGALWLAIGIAGSLLDRERSAQWRRAGAVVAGTYLLNTALKLAIGRRRPQLDGVPALMGTPTQLSFPSSHAATSFAAALAYSRLGLPALPLYALAVSMSASRLYVGVHYPSDILVGALLGSTVAALATASR